MSVELTAGTSPEPVVDKQWEPPMPPADLIFDDGEPLESNRHRIAMNALIRSVQQAWADRNDFFTGGNMFLYYSSAQFRNQCYQGFRGPDFFAVLNIDGSYPRQGWVVWEEGGLYPHVIVELTSPISAEIDTGPKKEIYERVFRTPDYFVYNPFNRNSLQGWHLDSSQGYQPLVADERGWLWCETLGFWLGTWEGTIDRETAAWLRFYDREGNLVLLPEEAAQQRAEQARQRAERERQRAEQAKEEAQQAQQRAERERQRAEQAQKKAQQVQQQVEQERQQAEQGQQQVEQKRQRAAQAQQLAEQERQRAERLAAQLRAMGVDPDTV